MKVYLIGYSMYTRAYTEDDNPMEIVEEAASMCYKSQPTYDFKIAKACAKSGHMSVFEHICFTFRIEGVSRALLAQLTRHRIASFSVESQRYTPARCVTDIEPVSCMRDDDTREAYFGAMNAAFDAYDTLATLGVPLEDARMVLPNACETNLVMTMNARELINASHLRLCSRAQWEIRELFRKLRDAVNLACPEVAAMMVPACDAHEIPFCEEGKCCGRHPKLTDLVKKEDV